MVGWGGKAKLIYSLPFEGKTICTMIMYITLRHMHALGDCTSDPMYRTRQTGTSWYVLPMDSVPDPAGELHTTDLWTMDIGQCPGDCDLPESQVGSWTHRPHPR